MSYTHFGINYLDLDAIPSREQAMAACRWGRAVASVQEDSAAILRIAIMGCMDMYRRYEAQVTLFSPVSEKKLENDIWLMLSRQELPPLEGAKKHDLCTRCLDELARVSESNANYHMRYACGYLANHINTGSNRSRDIELYLERAMSLTEGREYACIGCGTHKTRESMMAHVNTRGPLVSNSQGGRHICASCISDETYVYSGIMRQYLHEDEDIVHPDCFDGEPVTEDWCEANCDRDEDTGEWARRTGNPGDRLLNYSANPFDHATWDKRNAKNALVFGVELEMEPKSESVEAQLELVRLLGGSRAKGSNFILKSDGSLHSGVEMVTMPFTLEQHKEEKAIKWQKALSAVAKKAKSGAGTDRCGMHIHINKVALSALTIGKMLVFLNSESLAPLITTIAQRPSGHYCSRDGSKKIIDGSKSSENRYDIMNVSVSHPTCEIRMFKGNLKVERVYKNIEFCHALVQYCRQTSMADLQDWGSFSRWLISKRGTYSYLVQFLADKNTTGFRHLQQEANEFYSPARIEEA